MCQTLDGRTPAESQTAHCCCRLTQQVLQEMLLEVNRRDWPIALFAEKLGWVMALRNGSGWAARSSDIFTLNAVELYNSQGW